MQKLALITGASSGIGAEASRELAGLGFRVILVSALKKAIGLCARRFRHCAEAQISPYRAQIRADLMAATASFRP
ncbi:SDR family NAD(P)-dependent oxidoreductase, partial [Rhodoblastus sp.]|uniref:SDR family NAD(P)-dependent oxidoreductase n=1 Tax=Rhodoblastus sp. TaxID=1962975 RepID=UPI003F9745BA